MSVSGLPTFLISVKKVIYNNTKQWWDRTPVPV
jgi:hypothetical protein